MLPDGSLFGRFIEVDGSFHPIDKITVVGDNIVFHTPETVASVVEAQLRTAQAFGDKTTTLLSKFRIGVVGCSGTGSWVVEQLARLGVGELVLVDPDHIEKKNLNRIVNSTMASLGLSKVEVLKDSVEKFGTCRSIIAITSDLFSRGIGTELALCDIVFGCMDSVEGRDRLNRIAAFYCVPYLDLGVRLDADGNGGITNVSGAVHYLLPGGSSLLSRGVYTAERLAAESLRRTNPERYAEQLKEGYIKGAKVESPAVISVNGFCASMAVNEMLARIHPYRGDGNERLRWQQFDLVNSFWQQRNDGHRCPILAKMAGRADMEPYLNSTFVS